MQTNIENGKREQETRVRLPSIPRRVANDHATSVEFHVSHENRACLEFEIYIFSVTRTLFIYLFFFLLLKFFP